MLLTEEKAVAILDEIVKGVEDDYVNTDKVNGSCVYVLDDCPSCIIGHLAARLAPEKYAELEEYTSGPLALGAIGIMCDAETAFILGRIQSCQDHGMEWKLIIRAYHALGSEGLEELYQYAMQTYY
jgi:hypothetical protein